MMIGHVYDVEARYIEGGGYTTFGMRGLSLSHVSKRLNDMGLEPVKIRRFD